MDWTSEFRPERKADWADLAQSVRDTVSVEDALSIYCPSSQRRGHRCQCPLHNGRDLNFSFTRTGYKCFVCGESGDVIALVKEVCELATRADAIKRINADFRLNLPIGGEITEQASMEMARRRAEAERKKSLVKSWENRYNALMDEWIKLDKILREVNPDTAEAAETLAQAQARIIIVEDQLNGLPPEPRCG